MANLKIFKRIIAMACILALAVSLGVGYAVEAAPGEAGNKVLKIVTGTAQWEGASIKTDALKLQLGQRYDFSLRVYTPDKDVGVLVQTSSWTWVANATYSAGSGKWNTLTGSLDLRTVTEMPASIDVVKLGGGPNENAVVTFWIDDFTVTNKDTGAQVFFEGFDGASNAFTPSSRVSVVNDPGPVANQVLKIVTGAAQWEGIKITGANMNLGMGKNYKFTLKAYTPNTNVGLVFQTNPDNGWGWGDMVVSRGAAAFQPPGWYEMTGTLNLNKSGVTGLPTFVLTKLSGEGQYNESTTFYIDDFVVTEVGGAVVYSEDFQGTATRFENNGGTASIVPEATNEVQFVTGEYALDVPSLKEIYKDYFLMGNIVNPSDFGNTTDAIERYNILKRHYNILTFENAMKPDAMWGNGSSYSVPASLPSFSVDQYIKTMKNDGMLLHGHTLAWHGQSPNWLNLSAGNREDSTARYKPYAEAKANLSKYVSTIAGHYYNNPQGLSVYSWDVLNEAIRRNGSIAMDEANWGSHMLGHIWPAAWNSPWYEAYRTNAPAGVNPGDYAYDAFYYARQADPNATLYYNDYGMEDPNQVRMVVNMVNVVNKRYAQEHPEANGRLLIEGIGMQEHDTINTSLVNVENAIKAYIATGCKVSISELDVGVPGYQKGQKLALADEIKQGVYYANLFNILKKYSSGIDRVTFWGLNDNNWRPDELCLLFDTSNRTKLAYYAVANPDGFLQKYGN